MKNLFLKDVLKTDFVKNYGDYVNIMYSYHYKLKKRYEQLRQAQRSNFADGGTSFAKHFSAGLAQLRHQDSLNDWVNLSYKVVAKREPIISDTETGFMVSVAKLFMKFNEYYKDNKKDFFECFNGFEIVDERFKKELDSVFESEDTFLEVNSDFQQLAYYYDQYTFSLVNYCDYLTSSQICRMLQNDFDEHGNVVLCPDKETLPIQDITEKEVLSILSEINQAGYAADENTITLELKMKAKDMNEKDLHSAIEEARQKMQTIMAAKIRLENIYKRIIAANTMPKTSMTSRVIGRLTAPLSKPHGRKKPLENDYVYCHQAELMVIKHMFSEVGLENKTLNNLLARFGNKFVTIQTNEYVNHYIEECKADEAVMEYYENEKASILENIQQIKADLAEDRALEALIKEDEEKLRKQAEEDSKQQAENQGSSQSNG